METHRAQWKTRSGFLLAAIGSAIGLGNIWRFPYLCYANGGGAFLIPYLIALFTVGIPLLILEFSLGHKMRGSAPLSYFRISKHWEWLGWWAVILVMFGIVLYYAVVIAWCLSYIFFSFKLGWGSDPNAFFFERFLRVSSGPADLGNINTLIIFSLAVVWFLNWLIVYLGVQHGVERANKFFMPALFILTAILVFWSIRLPGANAGIRVYLQPDFSQLLNPRVWADAFAQIFYSLSLGFGIMIAYASYLPRKTPLVSNAFITGISDSAFSIFAGFAVFGTLGYISSQTGKPISAVVQQSIGLTFVSYPQAIFLLPHFASLFGVFFFTVLVMAGLTSSISIMEAFTAAVLDKFSWNRRQIVTVVAIIGFFGGIIFTTGAGLYWLDIVDHFLTNYGLIMVGILECVAVGWFYKTHRIREHLAELPGMRLIRWWEGAIVYLAPLVLGSLLVSSLLKEIQQPYGGYPRVSLLLIGRDWLLFTLIAAFLVTRYPWKETISLKEKNQ